ncbi:MAG: glycosyltransferase family 4 protein [Nitrospira sp.]
MIPFDHLAPDSVDDTKAKPRTFGSCQRLKVLLINQCFYPDHVATAQILTDLAQGLTEKAHHVTVVASSRGYDNPELNYPTFEKWNGIDIRRIWTPGLGKSSKLRRFIDFACFWFNALRLLLLIPKHDVVLSLTSPPLISILGTWIAWMKGGKSIAWIMDLNPDEAVAAGWLRQGSMPERILSKLQNWSFHRNSMVIALDRFMEARLKAKGVPKSALRIIPPWSHDQSLQRNPEAREAFRQKHGLAGKFVVMYSGNHSPIHPLDNILGAAERLRDRPDIHFLFVGGGSEFLKVQNFASDRKMQTITCLPYQPLSSLAASLTSADLHLVVMGQPFVGIVHPCKIYNVLSLGIPFLFVGPSPSHVTDIAASLALPDYAHLAENDVSEICAMILKASAKESLGESPAMRRMAGDFSHGILMPQLIDEVESAAYGDAVA